MNRLLISTMCCAFSINALAGGNESHGGLSIVCRNAADATTITSVSLLDIWESQCQHWLDNGDVFFLSIPESSEPAEHQINRALNRLQDADPEFAAGISRELEHIKSHWYPTAEGSALKLVETRDSFHYLNSEASACHTHLQQENVVCQAEQLINYRADGLVIYDHERWRFIRKKPTHVAGAQLHEAIYAHLRKPPYEIKDSRLARKVNGFILSDLEFTNSSFSDAWSHYIVPLLEAQAKKTLGNVKWVDASTGTDGQDIGSCQNSEDECVLLDQSTGLFWTSVNASPSEGLPFNWNPDDDYYVDKATRSCASLTSWGGYHNWRLPTADELREAYHHRIYDLDNKYREFGSNTDYFWSRTIDYTADGKHSVVNLSTGDARPAGVHSASIKWRCVRDEEEGDWRDVSWDPKKKERATCDRHEVDCILEHTPSGFMFTEKLPGTNFDPRDDSPQRRAVVDRPTALNLCRILNKSNWGGHNDWRTPSRQELGRAEYYGFLGASRSYAWFGNLYIGGFITNETETVIEGNARHTYAFKYHIGKNGWSTSLYKTEEGGKVTDDRSQHETSVGAAICVRGKQYE